MSFPPFVFCHKYRRERHPDREISSYTFSGEVIMSISKSLLVIGTFLLTSLPAFAQFGQVDGYVLGPDKKPILGAVIAVWHRARHEVIIPKPKRTKRLLSGSPL